MKRKLLKQIWSERRTNAWLIVELVLVSVVLWWLTDYLSYYWNIRHMPMGLDTENVVRIQLEQYNQDSDLYVDDSESAAVDEEDGATDPIIAQLNDLSRRLKENDEVESVCTAQWGELYNYNFSGRKIENVDSTSALKFIGRVNTFGVGPGYFNVFHPIPLRGEKPEEFMQMLRDGKVIVTDNIIDPSCGVSPDELYNKEVIIDGQRLTIGAVIAPVRRAEYEDAYHATCIYTPQWYSPRKYIYVRLKHSLTDSFTGYVNELDKSLRTNGNLHIVDMKTFLDIRNALHKNDDRSTRDLIIIMGFLLLTVFLGILGTFWFRTQERVREIAIRKVTGASDSHIFTRLAGEALLLLTFASIIAAAIVCIMTWQSLTMLTLTGAESYWAQTFVEIAEVYGIMAVMIVAGIWFPARRAMKIDPADTLRNE